MSLPDALKLFAWVASGEDTSLTVATSTCAGLPRPRGGVLVALEGLEWVLKGFIGFVGLKVSKYWAKQSEQGGQSRLQFLVGAEELLDSEAWGLMVRASSVLNPEPCDPKPLPPPSPPAPTPLP